jgi:hypothetical protein
MNIHHAVKLRTFRPALFCVADVPHVIGTNERSAMRAALLQQLLVKNVFVR